MPPFLVDDQLVGPQLQVLLLFTPVNFRSQIFNNFLHSILIESGSRDLQRVIIRFYAAISVSFYMFLKFLCACEHALSTLYIA